MGLAQALIADPEVLILDEPTVGLDPRQIVEIRSLVKSLAGAHTVILSTHILPEVSMVCEGVIIINRGRIKFDGRLSANALTGVVTHEQRNHPHIAPSKTEVTLSLAEPGLPTGRAATSYGQWQQEWKPILAARGPKW